MQLLLKIAAACGLVLVFFALAVWVYQRRLIYFPDPTRHNPTELGLVGVEEAILARPGGISIISWYTPAAKGQPTLLYFHGNGGNLAGRAERIATYQEAGIGVFMMSYRSYSGSTGSPNETDNVSDALAAYDALVQRGVASSDIVLYGESLGSGVAVQVAVAREVGAVILDAPFTSLADVGAQVYPYLPVHLAIADRYDSLSRIARINAPLLIVHGTRDQVVPHDMGRQLYEAAAEPKTFASIAGAGHSDHDRYGSDQIIQDWLANRFRPTP